MGVLTKYTASQKQEVLKLFWRTDLRWHEKVIDNQTSTICRETGVSTNLVNQIIDNDITDKIG